MTLPPFFRLRRALREDHPGTIATMSRISAGSRFTKAGVCVIEPRTLIAYSLLVVMVLAVIYLIARFRRDRTRRRDEMRGKYRGR